MEEGINRGPLTGAVVLGAVTLAAGVMTLSWSWLRSDVADGAMWHGAVAGAATITALVAAWVLLTWWRHQFVASAMWWTLVICAMAIHGAFDFAQSVPTWATSIVAVAAVVAATQAATSDLIDLTPAGLKVGGAAAVAVALGVALWWLLPAEAVAVAGWAAVSAVAIAHGLLRRQTLAGWVAVGALAVLHHDLLAIQADPGAVAAIGSGGVRLLGMVAMLLGVYHHMEQGHSELERRLHAAYASLDVMKRARASRMHEAEEKLHQARSALAAIDLAVQTLPADPELRHALTSELSLLRRLVTPASAVPAPFRVADAIVGVVAAERLYGVEVAVSVPAGLTAFGDLPGTAEIMQTLLENARFHAPGAPIEVRAARVGDAVEIAVADLGPGIDPGLDVFAPGVSGGRGQGLGLTIAARIAQGQGGRLSVDRSVESGTRFVLALPAGSGDRAHQVDDIGGVSDRRSAAQAGSLHHLGGAAAVTDRDDDV